MSSHCYLVCSFMNTLYREEALRSTKISTHKDAKLLKNINFKHRAYETSFFSLSNNVFAGGSKSARGGPLPGVQIRGGGPNPL